MFTFNFTQEELFAALSSFQGNTRRSTIGMFKTCSNVETALSIAYFLRKHKLGGLKVSASVNYFKVEIYLNLKANLQKIISSYKPQNLLLFV